MTARGIAGLALVLAVAAVAGCRQDDSPLAPPAAPVAQATPAPAAPNPPKIPVPVDPDCPALVRLSEAGRLALLVLLRTEQFTSDAVGEGGDVSVEVEALRVLFREEPAASADAFRHLSRQGSTAGKLFGLCGLWYADPKGFDEASADLAEEPEDYTVPTFVGCILSERPVAHLVRHRGPGTVVRLKDRSQTLDQWRAANPAEDVEYDIEGGAWPFLLRGEPAKPR